MAAPILQLGVTIQCPHGGMGNVVNTNTRVKVDGAFALLATDTYTITGCPFAIGTSPHPCVTIQWTAPAQRVLVDGNPVLLQTSIGLCKAADQLVQGTAIVSGVQTVAKGM